VQLRGVTSINATSSPLYVVDGVIVSNQSFGVGLNSITQAGGGISASQDQPVNRIADLNPEDIESIQQNLRGMGLLLQFGPLGWRGLTLARLLQEAQGTVSTAPAGAIAPGVALVVLVIGVNLVADGLRDVGDPTRRRSR